MRAWGMLGIPKMKLMAEWLLHICVLVLEFI